MVIEVERAKVRGHAPDVLTDVANVGNLANRALALVWKNGGKLTTVASSEVFTQARQVEQIGMAGIQAWQVWAAPWPTLSHCAAVTERVQLASGLANALTRSPFETALTAIDIDRLSGGRFILGLGPSIRAWTSIARSGSRPRAVSRAPKPASADCS